MKEFGFLIILKAFDFTNFKAKLFCLSLYPDIKYLFLKNEQATTFYCTFWIVFYLLQK
jgi:hypothetical protein